MTHLFPFKNKVGPQQFSQACLILSAIWLIVIYPAMIWLCPGKLPGEMKPAMESDFYQYYAGATVVKNGIWNALYPIPKPEAYAGPPHFTPRYKTFLFDPTKINGNLAFYPDVKNIMASDVSPELQACFPQAADNLRYIYPPPTALLLWPLSWVSFDCAINRLWPTIGIWSFFVLSLFASRIHRVLRQTDSYTEGIIFLACMFYSYRSSTISSGNVTPVLSGLIAFASYALMRKRLFGFSCAYIPLLLFKTIGLTWLPLLLCNRTYWRAMIYLAILTLLLNGIVIGLAGFGVYEEFFALAPKIAVPVGMGIVPSVLQLFGFYPRTFYLILNLTCLGFLYYGYWKNGMKGFVENPAPQTPFFLVALLAGTMALFCLTNFSVWLPYCPNYLFFPFLGWILQEGYLSSGYWRYFILGGTGLSFFVLASGWIVAGSLFHLVGGTSIGWYHNLVFQPSHVFFIPAFFLVVALRRLLSGFQAPTETFPET